MSMHSLIQSLLNQRARAARAAATRHQSSSQTLRFEPLELRRLLATVALEDFSVSHGTGEKPQSKVWEHADQWWTVMPSDEGAFVWRLDGTEWTPTLLLSPSKSVTADVKSIGNVAHVLLFDGSSSQLASIEYDGAGNYAAWTMRPTLVPIALTDAETATIDVDSTGRLWVAADSGSQVQVRYADGLYQSWSAPITVASGIKSDDISVITALPNGTVGVLWSNQNTKRFGFRYHVDGAAPTEWSTDELPAAAAALNVGAGMADDHLHVAVASDGTIYAAVKTSYDSGGQTKLGLLVRRPNGVWDNTLYRVDTDGTRPIVLLNEAEGKLIVAYAAAEGTANIVYRETSLNTISFGARQTMIGGSVQNVSSTKQNFTDEVVLIASNGSTLKSAMFSFGAIIINQPPDVEAGIDRTIAVGAAVTLNASVEDDGLPSATSLMWSKLSGPGTASFDDATQPGAKVTFSQPGTYVLRVVATDGQYFDDDEVTITVTAPTPDPEPSTSVTVNASFQDGVGGYAGGRDTMIRALNANTNYGSQTSLEADGSPDIASLLGWDLASIPTGSTIVSAAIELNITNSSAHTYGLYAMERAWDEFGATWNQAGAGRSWGSAGANAASDRSSASIALVNARNTGVLRIEFTATGLSVVQQWINDPAENHGVILQNYVDASDGLDFRSNEFATASMRPRLILTYKTPGDDVPPPTPTNVAPTVNAGPDRSITTGQSASLAGAASDDGLPGPLTLQWTKQSGPGNVAFGNSAAAATTATFSLPGTYVLRLTGNDGSLTAYDEMTVTVTNAPPVNQPPTVSAGADRAVQLGSALSLSGQINDDGVSGPVTSTWSKTSGPGTVTFGSAGNASTTVTFSQAGTYVLRFTANDGQYSAQDEVTVTVQPASPPPSTPVTATFQDGVAGYSGTRDTMIWAQNPTSNYGTLNTLQADGSPDIAGLVSWNLSSIPAGSIVSSATIELYIANTTDDSYSLLAMERAWRELEATWNQAGAGLSWATAGAGATTDRASASLGALSPRSNGRYAITLNAAGIAAVQRWINDPSKNFGVIIQNYATASNGMDFRSRETADATQRPKLSVTYQAAAAEPNTPPPDAEPTNAPPQVNAGADRTATAGSAIPLNGVVNDDGHPGAPVTVAWTKFSGPGTVQFTSAGTATTNATFSTAGVYVLRLTASDGELSAFDEITINVSAQPAPNQPPSVSAGADQTVAQAAGATLAGNVTDDGPAANVTATWSKMSGPGNVTFDNAASLTAKSSFSAPGAYVLRLTASDGSASAYDEVTITVQAPSGVDPALVGVWQMESTTGGSVADGSGNGRNATVVGTPATSAGVTGNALTFAKNSYLLVNNAPELNPTNQVTIAAWIKPSATGTQYVIKKGRQDATDGYEISLSSDGKVFVRFNQATSGDAYRVNSTAKYPTNGTWMHVAATYDGQTIKLYINGVLQGSKNAVFQIASSNLPLAIGAQDDGYREFTGAVDGVHFYNRALTAAEIAALKANV